MGYPTSRISYIYMVQSTQDHHRSPNPINLHKNAQKHENCGHACLSIPARVSKRIPALWRESRRDLRKVRLIWSLHIKKPYRYSNRIYIYIYMQDLHLILSSNYREWCVCRASPDARLLWYGPEPERHISAFRAYVNTHTNTPIDKHRCNTAERATTASSAIANKVSTCFFFFLCIIGFWVYSNLHGLLVIKRV